MLHSDEIYALIKTCYISHAYFGQSLVTWNKMKDKADMMLERDTERSIFSSIYFSISIER
jgi:hypothetical protein